MSWDTIQAILLTTLTLASLYALMATGLSLVWGSLRLFNFAHGALMAVGAYLAWTAAAYLGLPPIAAAIVGTLGLVVIGLILEQVLIAPFASRADAAMVVIITTLAGSIFLENGIHIIWGPRLKRLEPLIDGSVDVLGTTISAQEALVAIAAPVILTILAIFLKRSRMGMAIRAVEQNRDAALLTGIKPTVIFLFTFGIAAALAAVAGIMLGSSRFITPTLGATPLLKAFIVVILGGLGSLGGTIAAAYLVGAIEAIAIAVVGLYWSPVVLFAIMIVVLIFKPTGLFGVE